MLKAKVLKTTSSTLINYAKVLRSHTRTSVDVQPSRVKCEPLRINIKQTVWHGHHVKCSHHPCTEPTSCQHCSRRCKSDNSAAQAMGRTIDEPFVEGFQKQAMGGRRGHLDGGHKQDHSVYRHKDAPASVAQTSRDYKP